MRCVSHVQSSAWIRRGCGGHGPRATGHRPPATGHRVILRVLVVARERMVAERTRVINALTALLRTIDLGVDTRKALSHSQFKVIAAWLDGGEDSVVRTCRQEAIRLATRICALDGELVDNRKALDAAVEAVAPELCELPGVGSVVAACVLTAWSHPPVDVDSTDPQRQRTVATTVTLRKVGL
jgi:transposase